MNGEESALRALVGDGVADAEFLAHASLLVDAGVPIIVAGPTPSLTARVAESFALASPVPGAAGVGGEITVEGDHGFEWLADPKGIGCVDPRAGSAPRSPRTSRLRIKGLLSALDPSTARTALRALGRGFPAIVEASATDLATLLERLRSDPHRLPEGDVRGLGLVAILDESRLVAAHLLHAGEAGERRAPTLLAVWDPSARRWDDFAWAFAPEAAQRCGLSQPEYESRRQARLSILGHGVRQ